MATYNTLTDFLSAIANAIREKDETSSPIVANTYPERILAITGNVPKPVATEQEMDTYLTSGNVGRVYQYTGPDTMRYNTYSLYVVEDTEDAEL